MQKATVQVPTEPSAAGSRQSFGIRAIAPLVAVLAAIAAAPAALAQFDGPSGQLSGTVERVWEDGFHLRTAARRVRVDSWDRCGDNTPRHISTGDRLTVTGEFEGGEFDAFAIEDTEGNEICAGQARRGD